MSKQTEMLSRAIDLIIGAFTGTDREKTVLQAFEDVVNFVAYKLSYGEMVATPSLPIAIWHEVNTLLDLTVLREDRWDHLGDVYQERGLDRKTPNHYFQISREDFETFAGQIPLQKHTIPDRFLDTWMGTGKLMIALYDHLGNRGIYYGACPDSLLYQVACVNAKLYNIPAKLICADALKHDISEGSSNWQYANMWMPPKDKHWVKINE